MNTTLRLRALLTWSALTLTVCAVTRARADDDGPSLTDFEISTLCEPRSGASSATTPQSIEVLEKQVEDLEDKIESKKRELTEKSAQTKEARALQLEKLENLESQKPALLEALRDRRASGFTQRRTEARGAMLAITACRDAAANQEWRTAADQVCAAYERRARIPWKTATTVAACIRQSPGQRVAVRTLVPELQAEGARGIEPTTDRVLSGAALETAILRETAEFLVDRAEQEMSLFASEVIGSRLCAEGSTTLKMFTETCKLLAPPDDAPALGATPAALRDAARADLENLPEWVTTTLSEKQPKRACSVAVSWAFAGEAIHGANVLRLLASMETLLDRSSVKKSCARAPEVDKQVRELSEALRKILATEGVDVPTLLKQREVDFLVSRVAREFNTDDGFTPIGATVREVLSRVSDLMQAIATYEGEPNAGHRASVIIAALRTSEPLIVFAVGSDDEDVLSDLRSISEGIGYIGAREYPAAVMSFLKLHMVAEAPELKNARTLVAFGATLAQADSADAVRAAFDDAALPLQSWRRKNQPRGGATLTGFVGFQPTYEFVIEKSQDLDNGFSFAPTLLLGPDLHLGFGGCRLGLLFSVLDLGALATIRLDQPKAEGDLKDAKQEPHVRIEQVFAPGGYAYFGWGPFDFGLGASFVPSLRPAHDSNGGEEPLNVLRVGLLLAVDVSILPLF